MGFAVKADLRPYRPVPPKRFTPVGNKIAIHVFDAPELASGLVMPDGSEGSWESVRARVIAVGPDVKQVKEGDLILTAANAPIQKVRYDGLEYCLLPENIVSAVVDKEYEKEK